jgi:uncharacterized protein (DUF1697 family)
MDTYVALLRGINVGRNKRIDMAGLREILTSLGHREVRTLLQSGNVVFEAEPGRTPELLAEQIETAVADRYGFTARTLVREGADVARVLDANPFPEHSADGSKYLVGFLSDAPSPEHTRELAAIDQSAHAPVRWQLIGRELYVYYGDGLRNSKLDNTYWERTLGGVTSTMRNWNTVSKLRALVEAAPR